MHPDYLHPDSPKWYRTNLKIPRKLKKRLKATEGWKAWRKKDYYVYGYGWDVDYDEFSSFMYRRVEFDFTKKATTRMHKRELQRIKRLKLALDNDYPF
ncbi:hypothetical protein KLP40_14520 [Hymenobacter sp. NST-14]|uniref:hypothetical protein n=1 Tax=Hymenobacter piscis TaxID=2839984 RepID=UPI001C00963D|nr:hypothetical protein [Hymenobacter piscis]MBT9394382.1 hypothetical protein [Hymenobacter piscis]